MYSSFFTKVFLLLSFLCTTGLAASDKPFAVLTVRQSDPTATQCLDYATTANLSTIGANSTYRSAFLQMSPLGSLANAKVLNAAIAKLPALTRDQTLNDQCGNLTTVAFTEAANNFSQGIVGPFSGLVGNPQAIKAGPEVVIIVGGIILMFSCVWSFMP